MKKFATRFSMLVCLLMFTNVSIWANETPEDKEKTIIEIRDKYNEIRLGLTKKVIYLKFDSALKDFMNEEISASYNLLTNQFIDSEGYFMPGEITLLKENKLVYHLSDIENIDFNKGKIIFHYKRTKDFIFEDILNTDGNPALQNFYLEDLERFYLAYRNLVS